MESELHPMNQGQGFFWLDAPDIPSLVPTRPGSYLLLMFLAQPVSLRAGRLPQRIYPAGWYVYSGSALRGLSARLTRYTRPDRKKHWHIDYLLDHADVLGAYIIEGTEQYECVLARGLAEQIESIPGFGCSDCRCSSHLFHAAGEECMRTAITFALHERFIDRTKLLR